MNAIRRILIIFIVAVITVTGADAQQSSRTRKKSKARTEQTQGNKGKTSGRKTAKGKSSGSSKTRQKAPTKAELQRQQQATQQEIAETKRKIQENERQVSRNLAELTKLQQDITVSKGQVAESSRRVGLLQGQISTLQGQISTEQKEVNRLRAEYLKAVKAVRKRKNTNSDLAYIFSSKSFADAARRMRYLREFAEWRDRQTADIQGRIKDLEGKRHKLSQNKVMYDKALATNVAAQKSLENQYGKQDAIVTELKANGSALRSHLAKKQSEVNSLKNRVAALIAAEQAEAERKAAEQRRAEERRLAEQRRAEERRAREEAERQRQQELAQAQAREETEAKEEPVRKKEVKKLEPKKEPKKDIKKDTRQELKREQRKERRKEPVREEPRKEPKRDQGNVSYADARKRRPRGDGKNSSVPKTVNPERGTSKSSASGFAGMRGSLPRPVSGAFRVTSMFGVHSLPDLPDVKYDNPGIDAEVARGAAAQAVYAGKVSGVYMIPGFATVVIVNHGEYYTVYGNLASASVKVGDVVKAGQTVGSVAESEDNPGHGQIHFEVWKNREKQNPMAWIR